jgi:hypothetical protein
MFTPFVHRNIFTRRRGHYCFRDRLLSDGLHPRRDVQIQWTGILEQTLHKNSDTLERRDRRRQGRRSRRQ